MPDGNELRFRRTVFKTSRDLDFLDRGNLTAQIGHPIEDWPRVIFKELGDNVLDSAEETGIAPVITIAVATDPGRITVADNAAGIPREVVKDILDYSVRVSSREVYVSPTRGAQGNALKTIIAMPFALADGEANRRGETIIESYGEAHHIVFAADPIRQKVDIADEIEPSEVKTGTRVTVNWPTTARHLLADSDAEFLQMAEEFGLFNPHLSITLIWNDEILLEYPATNPNWQKWRPSDPTSIHWYSQGQLERYLGAYLADDLDHQRQPRPLRDIVSTFRGLTGSAKAATVLDEAGLGRPSLASLFPSRGTIDHDAIARLLTAMKANSKPVNPEQLGVVGRDHFEPLLVDGDHAVAESFRYKRVSGGHNGIPYIVEGAFACYSKDRDFDLFTGVNFSPSINQPFRFPYRRLEDKLTSRSIYPSSPVTMALHFTCAHPQFTDRGKSTIAIPAAIEHAFAEVITFITANWARSEEAQERAEERERRESERRMRAATAKPKRERSTVVGSGALYREIAAAAAESDWSITNLTVLSPKNDPYRFDTTTGHANGKWFAAQVERLLGTTARVHLRGLFYRIVVIGDIRRPDGKLFVNNDANWRWLTESASKAARWLEYVRFERIVDERNAPPFLYLPESPGSGVGRFEPGDSIVIPGLDPLLPHLDVIAPSGRQPYRIVLLGEKSSLQEVLLPIAQQVKGELLLPTGESTESMIAEMVDRAAKADRPTIVLYFSDFDPAGWQMSLSVARKLQAHRTLRYRELQCELHRVALTLDQVRRFDLPSTPLKVTEKRSRRWREAMGHEQTELDALAALRPGDLHEIALNAVAPFYDFTLDERCRQAGEAWLKEAEAKIAGHPARAVAQDQIARGYNRTKDMIAAVHKIQANTYATLKAVLGIEETEIEAPQAQIGAVAPVPLFTTDDDFATASLKLIAEKKYELEGEAEEEEPDDDDDEFDDDDNV